MMQFLIAAPSSGSGKTTVACAVLAALKKRAYEHKDTVRIGRSHGIHAEPTTMGLTFARFYAEMARGTTRASLIAEIDHARPPEVGLATACRLFVLAELTREG